MASVPYTGEQKSGLPISSLPHLPERQGKNPMPDQSVRPTRVLPRLLCLLICTLCLDRQAGLQAAESAVVESVSATAEQVSIALSAPAPFRQASLAADPDTNHRPYRCYVDIAPARLGERVLSSLDVRQDVVQRVRVAQFRPDTARVVLDLVDEGACQVRALTRPHRLVVRVEKAEPASSPIRLAAVAHGVALRCPAVSHTVGASGSQPGVTVSSGSPATPESTPAPPPSPGA